MLFLLIIFINLFIAFYFVLINNYILYLSKVMEQHNLVIEFNILFFSAAVVLQPILMYIRKIVGKKRVIMISIISFIIAILLLVYGIVHKNIDIMYLGALAEGIAFSVMFPLLSSMLVSLDKKNSGKNLNNIEILWSVIAILIPITILYIDLNTFIIISFLTALALLIILILIYWYVDDESLRTYRFTRSDIRRISLIILVIASIIYMVNNINIYTLAVILLALIVYIIKNRRAFDRLNIIINDRNTVLLGLTLLAIVGFYIPINLSGWIYISILGLDSNEMFQIITIITILSIISLSLSGKLMDEYQYYKLLSIGFIFTTLSSILTFFGAYVVAIAFLVLGVNIFGPLLTRKLLMDVDDENKRESLSNTYLLTVRVATLVSIKIGYVIIQQIGMFGVFMMILLVAIIYYNIFKNTILSHRVSLSQI